VNSQTVHTRAASLPIDAVRGRRYVSFVAHSSQIPLATCADGAIAREIAASDAGEAAAAETELYRRFAPRVRLYGYKHLSDRGAADDLAQQVMLVVITRLRAGEVRDPDQIGSFVLGASRMMVAGQRRGERRRAALHARFDMPDAMVAASDAVSLDRDRIAPCLAAIRERERTILLLSFYAEKSTNEIADALGTTPGAVRVSRHRALAAMRDCIETRRTS
jgi:RNA polymerase sigma-70 factor, ECF subfamily